MGIDEEENEVHAVYAYEVTKSNVDTVKVGTFVIDEDWEGYDTRSWSLWDSKTGEFFTGWVGVRRERACRMCWEYARDPMSRPVRPHGHEGPHGPGESLRPTRVGAEVSA